MVDTIGHHAAEKSLLLKMLYTAKEALALKLVDEVIPVDQVRARALTMAKELQQIPFGAHVASKMLIRQGRLDHMQATRQQDLAHIVEFVTKEKVQKSLGAYLNKLANKKKKSKWLL